MHQRRKLALAGVTAAALAVLPAGSAMAAAPDRAENPFVCPVLTLPDQAVANSGTFNSIGNGQYTFAPGAAGSADTFNGNVPSHATNAEGAGSPGGFHAAPGDPGYTAIWSGNPPAAG
jgi:ABC-type phosphate transport system substrate-binding protein